MGVALVMTYLYFSSNGRCDMKSSLVHTGLLQRPPLDIHTTRFDTPILVATHKVDSDFNSPV